MKQLTVVFCSHVLAAHLYRSDGNGGGRQPQRSRSHSKTPGGRSSGDRRKRERQARHRSPSHEEEGQITDRYSSYSMHPPSPKVYFTVFVEHVCVNMSSLVCSMSAWCSICFILLAATRMSSYNIWGHVSLWHEICDVWMVYSHCILLVPSSLCDVQKHSCFRWLQANNPVSCLRDGCS